MACKYGELQPTTPDVDHSQASRHLARALTLAGHPIGPTVIKDHRAGTCSCKREAGTVEPVKTATAGKVEVGPNGGTFEDVQTDAPISDWGPIFERFRLDPDAWIVDGNSIRMSHWQQSRRLATGDRDIVDLYSYRAKFRRKPESFVDMDALRKLVRTQPAPLVLADTSPETYVVGLADWQLGKSERGSGTADTVKRIKHGLASVSAHLDQLEALGRMPDTLLLANLGDHVENVNGSYESQRYSVDLNMRDQINLAIELNLLWIKTLAPRFRRVQYAATLCNHGQLTRGSGRDNVTDDADNSTGLIGDTLRQLAGLTPNLAHVEFAIPRDEMITQVTTSGVNIPLAHGHKITGKEEAWLAQQSHGLTRAGFTPDIWFTAHRHSASIDDYGPYVRIQATTVDPGSKWFTDTTGKYARPGTTSFIVGEHLPGKWDAYRIH